MLRLTHVTKRFGATLAVDDVSLDIGPGEIVGLVGENGAGKTTLMRMAAGEIATDSGTIDVQGAIELVHQHFMLVGDFTIAENLALWGVTSEIPLPDPSRKVNDLSVGEKAKLELAKAIGRNPRVLILDEPTSVLTPVETDELFRVMREIASRGTAVVFISHKLPEVLAIAQRIVVMRRGKIVALTTAAEMTAAELAEAMVDAPATTGGAPAPSPARAGGGSGAPLHLSSLTGAHIDHVTLTVHQNEIVAIVGVAGNGQDELAAMLRGLVKPKSGAIEIGGSVGHIPPDRTRDGLVAQMTIAENIALPSPRWNRGAAIRHAAQLIELYSIRARGPLQKAGGLSGGNQQKVILARELDRRPEVLVASEPTRGLDIESTRFVHAQLRAAAAAGAAILVITSDLDEAFALADAIQVIYRGRLSERMSAHEAAARVGGLMAGLA
jgi:simple sugar transport system ATP-binding protein